MPDRLRRVPAREPSARGFPVRVRRAVWARRGRQIRQVRPRGALGVPRGAQGQGRHRDCRPSVPQRGAPRSAPSSSFSLLTSAPHQTDDEPLLCRDAQRAPPPRRQARPPHVNLYTALPLLRLHLAARGPAAPHRLQGRARREQAAERVWRVDELGVGGRGRGREVRGTGGGGVR